LGFLTTATATGSLISAFIFSSLGDFRHKGAVMMTGLLLFGTLLIVFSHVPWPWLAAVILFLIGASTQAYQTTNATLMQLLVPTFPIRHAKGRGVFLLYDRRPAARFGERDMGHRRVLRRAVPVLLTGYHVDDVARMDFLLQPLVGDVTHAVGHEQHLITGMNVPFVSGADGEIHHRQRVILAVAEQ